MRFLLRGRGESACRELQSDAHPPAFAAVTLAALVAALVFALGCHNICDGDVWWHLRTGRWIKAEWRIPREDMFSFVSVNRPWIDLHWGFQLLLATAYDAGGMSGIILFTATAGTAAVLIALIGSGVGGKPSVVAAAWLPAILLIGTRYDPRPEILSLVYLSVFLAVLFHAPGMPALAWVLPPIQVLWVNSHSLFVLGPIVLACYVLERGVRGAVSRMLGGGWGPGWRHTLSAFSAVLVAGLLNPYGLSGMMFPLELFGKISNPRNMYKTTIAELLSPRARVQFEGLEAVSNSLDTRCLYLLLLLLPLSLLFPIAWGRWRQRLGTGSSVEPGGGRSWAGGWVATAATATVFALVRTYGLPGSSAPGWWIALDGAVPALALIAAAGFAGLIWRTDKASATLLAGGLTFVVLWSAWLRSYLLVSLPSPGLTLVTAIAASLTLVLSLGLGADLFLLGVSVAFGYLGVEAVRNTPLFALVSGAVIARCLSVWHRGLAADLVGCPGGICQRAERLLLVTVCLILPAIALGVVNDRFYKWTGETHRSGLREVPFLYAHGASRFSGGPGLPERALALDLEQAAVYLYHNGPERKVFLDPRLEVPETRVFQKYLDLTGWLRTDDPRWIPELRRLGSPLVILRHDSDYEAEATLLANSGWRCVYYDAVASVFVSSQLRYLEARYPTVSFSARHFRPGAPAPAPLALVEAKALTDLGEALRLRSGSSAGLRSSVLLLATSLGRRAAESLPGAWVVLGRCYASMVPDPFADHGVDRHWDSSDDLLWAQSTYCFRQALELDPGNRDAADDLRQSFAIRGIRHERVSESLGDGATVDWEGLDRFASNAMRLGDPHTARVAFMRAPPGVPNWILESRIAETYLVEGDVASAERHFRVALSRQPGQMGALCGLAILLAQAGSAEAALSTCREGLGNGPSRGQRELLSQLRDALSEAVPSSDGERESGHRQSAEGDDR